MQLNRVAGGKKRPPANFFNGKCDVTELTICISEENTKL